jgi:hypothetical protein
MQRRALHDFAFAPSIDSSRRTTALPFAAPMISMIPEACDGAAMLIDIADCASACAVIKAEAIKDAEIAQCRTRKAVSSPERRPTFLPYDEQPFLR